MAKNTPTRGDTQTLLAVLSRHISGESSVNTEASVRAEIDGLTTPRLITAREVAAQYGLGLEHLEKLRWSGGGPEFYKIGRRVLYQRSDIEAWLAARRRASTSQVR